MTGSTRTPSHTRHKSLKSPVHRNGARRVRREAARKRPGFIQHEPRDLAGQPTLLMDLGEQPHRVKLMIRDRSSNFTAAFDAALADAGIRTVLCNVQTPRMNAIIERWIGGCRRELLDRTLVWNQTHLRQILRAYRDPPQSAPAAPLPARRRAAETPTRTDRSRPVPHPKAGSHRLPDQRIPPGRMTWTRFSARTPRSQDQSECQIEWQMALVEADLASVRAGLSSCSRR